MVSEDAEFLDEIPSEFAVALHGRPPGEIRELLETDDDRYRAVLSDRKGCANSGLLVQQVLALSRRRYPDRFRYVDQHPVDRIVVGAGGVVLHALGHAVSASRVVLCTNGFVDHAVEDAGGAPIQLHEDQRVTGRVGYMAAFVEEPPRPPAAMSYIRNPSSAATRRMCMSPGGPTSDPTAPSR